MTTLVGIWRCPGAVPARLAALLSIVDSPQHENVVAGEIVDVVGALQQHQLRKNGHGLKVNAEGPKNLRTIEQAELHVFGGEGGEKASSLLGKATETSVRRRLHVLIRAC